jgi:DNA-directed RNA polymerase specialized sigma24 family protein
MKLYSLESLALDPPLATDNTAEIEELRECIAEQLRRLSPRERDALSAWARVSGESCRDVAERYGKSPQTVCNWAGSAIRKLRPKLEAHL